MSARFTKVVLPIVGTGLLTMLQVGPDDAARNFCKWPRLFIDISPDCISGISATALRWFAVGLILVGIFWILAPSIGPKSFARRKLRALRKGGVTIRNEGQSTTDVASWTPKFLAWHSAVLFEAGRLSPDFEASLDPINKIPQKSIEAVAVNDPAHQINVSFMSEVIRRIEVFLATGDVYGHK
jgi:hypothetical protein